MKKIYLIILLVVVIMILFLMIMGNYFNKRSLSTVPEEVFQENKRFLKEVLGVNRIKPLRRITSRSIPFEDYHSFPVSSLQQPIISDIFVIEYLIEEREIVYLGCSYNIPKVVCFFCKDKKKLFMRRNNNTEISFFNLINYLGLPKDISCYKMKVTKISEDLMWADYEGLYSGKSNLHKYLYPELKEILDEKKRIAICFNACFLVNNRNESTIISFHYDPTVLVDAMLKFKRI
ncbi:MAG: hypothetical protein ACP5UA_14285 [Candidatus Hydrogenedens sp.]